jgi:flagellar export protein FliJ
MQRRDNLKGSIDGLKSQLANAQDQLTEAFEELKKVELLEERNMERDRQTENMRVQAEMDAIGLAMHMRTT